MTEDQRKALQEINNLFNEIQIIYDGIFDKYVIYKATITRMKTVQIRFDSLKFGEY